MQQFPVLGLRFWAVVPSISSPEVLWFDLPSICTCNTSAKNRRTSRELVFLIGLRQAKVVDGIHGNKCIRRDIVYRGVAAFVPDTLEQ